MIKCPIKYSHRLKVAWAIEQVKSMEDLEIKPRRLIFDNFNMGDYSIAEGVVKAIVEVTGAKENSVRSTLSSYRRDNSIKTPKRLPL